MRNLLGFIFVGVKTIFFTLLALAVSPGFAEGWHNLNKEEVDVFAGPSVGQKIPELKILASGIVNEAPKADVYASAMAKIAPLDSESENTGVSLAAAAANAQSSSLSIFQATAEVLDNDEDKIIDYVMAEIAPEYYYGIRKSEAMTLHEKLGNDYEKCLLAYKLLNEAGKSSDYYLMKCWVKMPISETEGGNYCVENYLGCRGLNSTTAAAGISQLGMPAYSGYKDENGTEVPFDGYVLVLRVMLVKLDSDGKVVRTIDPYMFKKTFTPGTGLNVSAEELLTAAEGVVESDTVSKINRAALELKIKKIADGLEKLDEQEIDSLIGKFEYEYYNTPEEINPVSLELIYPGINLIESHGNVLKVLYLTDESSSGNNSIVGLLYKTPPEADKAKLEIITANKSKSFTLTWLDGDKLWFRFGPSNQKHNPSIELYRKSEKIFNDTASELADVKVKITYPFHPMLGASVTKQISDKILRNHQSIYVIAYVPTPSKYAIEKARIRASYNTRGALKSGDIDKNGTYKTPEVGYSVKGETLDRYQSLKIKYWLEQVNTEYLNFTDYSTTSDALDVIYPDGIQAWELALMAEILGRYTEEITEQDLLDYKIVRVGLMGGCLQWSPRQATCDSISAHLTNFHLSSDDEEEWKQLWQAYFYHDIELDYEPDRYTDLQKTMTSDCLELMALEWMHQTHMLSKMIGKINSCDTFISRRLGRTTQQHNGSGAGFFIDVSVNDLVSIPLDINESKEDETFKLFSLYASAFEHSIIAQLQSGQSAMSTINAIYYANEQDYLIECSESSTSNGIWLEPVPDNVAPRSWDWKGSGYMYMSDERIYMSIRGNYNGGYASQFGLITYNPIQNYYTSSANFSKTNPSSAYYEELFRIPSERIPITAVADPVDLYSGAYFLDVDDIAVGDRIKFTRHYNSNNCYSKDAGLGYGWTHNYDIGLMFNSNIEAALKPQKVKDSSYLLATIYATKSILEHYGEVGGGISNGERARILSSGCLVVGMGVDSLYNNYVTVYIGKDSMSFRKTLKNTGTEDAPVYEDYYDSPLGTNYSLEKNGETQYTLKEPYGNTIVFDKIGDRFVATSIKDAWNKGLTLAYESEKPYNLIKVTDTNSKSLFFTWKDGVITKVSDSESASGAYYVEYFYDPIGSEKIVGNLRSVKNSLDGVISRYYYNDSSQMTSMSDANGDEVIKNFYNSNGAIWKQYCGGDPEKAWTFVYTGKANQEIDPLGNVKTYYYDDRGINIGIKDQLGRTTSFEYDEFIRPTKTIFPNGDEIRCTYDKWHNKLSEDVYEKQGESLVWKSGTVFTYESEEQSGGDVPRLLASTRRDSEDSATGRTSTIEGYYLKGKIKTNLPLKIIDENGVATVNDYYSGFPRIMTQTVGGRKTTYGSLVNSNTDWPRTIKTPDGFTEALSYNTHGDIIKSVKYGVTTEYELDLFRRVTKTTVKGSGHDPYVTETFYDKTGKVIKEVDSDGITTEYVWDVSGNKLSETVSGGDFSLKTEYVYDLAGRLVETKLPSGISSAMVLDAAGQVVSSKEGDKVVSYTYDSRGRQTRVLTHPNYSVDYTYDALGNQTSMTDGRGNTVNYEYDCYGELVKVTNRRGGEYAMSTDIGVRKSTLVTPMGKTTTSNYAQNTWDLASVVSPSGKTSTNTYSASSGKLTKTVDDAGTISYTYSESKGKLYKASEGGKTITYTYDGHRNVKTSNAESLTVTYTYTNTGKIKTITYPSQNNVGSKVVTYDYDALGRLSTITDWAGRVTSYSYDFAGRLVGMTRPNGTERRIIYNPKNGNIDAIEELRSDGGIISRASFGYDSSGRITSRARYPKAPLVLRPDILAEYDLDNQISSFSLAAAPITVTYDEDGNMTSGPITENESAVFAYDARNRLTLVTPAVDKKTTYAYDAEDNRTLVKFTDNGVAKEISYVYDRSGDNSEVLIRNIKTVSTKKSTYYVYGLGLVYEVSFAGKNEDDVKYYHYDHTGSTVALTNAEGAVTDRYAYDVWGKSKHYSGESDTPFQYVGMSGVQTDPNGLVNMRARYYNPLTMTFLSLDPIGFEGGMNWYMYANGDPMGYTDPAGLCASSVLNSFAQTSSSWSQNQFYDFQQSMSAHINDYYYRQDNLDAVWGMFPLVGKIQNYENGGSFWGEVALDVASMLPAGKIAGGAKMLSKISKISKVASSASKYSREARILGNATRKIVIGENMKRVAPYAKSIGAEIYSGPADLAINQAWIEKKMSKGYKVIDIGPDFRRRFQRDIREPGGFSGVSPFYNMERKTTKGYNNYYKNFSRNGRYWN